MSELTVTDLFCGAGGSSSGAIAVPGVRVRMAANHWNLAIETHNTNHPDSADISQVDPRRYPFTDILWASPECTNHSQAKGKKRASTQAEFDLGDKPLPDEAAERSRATMWDVPRFAEYHRYRAIVIENVVDAYRWIPFPAWLHTMELLGYEHEIVWLNSMHAQALGLPAPQSRDRMYVVFWLKGNRRPDLQKWTRPRAFCTEHGVIRAVQVFKKRERWGRYRAQYVYKCPSCAVVVEPGWLPAYTAIDWTVRGQRIGDREKPLAPKTRERIQRGIERYWRPVVVEAAGNAYDSTDPKHAQHGDPNGYVRAWPTEEALRTLHTTASKAVAVPPLIVNQVSGSDATRSTDIAEVMPTLVAGGLHASLLVPVEGRDGKVATPAADPMRTQSTRNETGIVIPLRANNTAKSTNETFDTFAAAGMHHGLLMRNNTARGDAGQMVTPVAEPARTLTTHGHQSLLTPTAPVSLEVDDCEFRMLEPDEIKRGMAFDAEYVLLGTKREKVRLAGNAVTPPAARDLIAAVAESLGSEIEVAS
jgi:DNA (cytosine-5)-methyltransferase 1